MFANKLRDESGVALIFAILMLALLSIIGLSTSSNTELELKISGNEKAHKMAFYFADGGNEVSKELIEEGIEERGWKEISGTTITLDKVTVEDKDFFLASDWEDTTIFTDGPNSPGTFPTATYRDATVNFGTGTTALIFGSNSRLSSGGAVQMIAGYEGKGKGSASGGAWLIYDVRSQHDGPNNSSARVRSQWLHLL